MANGDIREPVGQPVSYDGPVWARVVSNVDPTYMGGLEVQIMREVGNDEDVSGQVVPVKYLSPFFGSTAKKFVTDQENYDNTQKSFGMWMVPPDVGTWVVCIFINGDYRKGYWIGCVLEENMNFSVPGHAATKYKVDGLDERVPVAEYNKVSRGSNQDPTKILKVESPLSKTLSDQGLLRDDIRGITTSSARRESPSSVFGISTPGPLDKRSGAKKGKIGKSEYQIADAPVSRLGGSTFVMDDGDDKFLRKTSPSEGPPEYASVEQKEKGGDVTRPHNELLRLRTRTGHQILLHNSEDLIYIGNARGTTWIELTSDGKIDIFAEDSINIRTKQDFNFYADRDINLEAGRNFNMKAGNEFHMESTEDMNIIIGANGKITTAGNLNINSVGNHIETAAQIHMNGPVAEKAKPLKIHELPQENLAPLNSIMRRIPTMEPYPQHENLDPLAYKPSKTDRDIDGRYEGQSTTINEPAEKWKKYSTVVDTFEKIKG